MVLWYGIAGTPKIHFKEMCSFYYLHNMIPEREKKAFIEHLWSSTSCVIIII